MAEDGNYTSNQSGGVNASGDLSTGGDVTGRDKIVSVTNIYQTWRPWVWVGIVVSLFVFGMLFYSIVTGTDRTATLDQVPSKNFVALSLKKQSNIQPDGSIVNSTYLNAGDIGEGELEITSPNQLEIGRSKFVRLSIIPDQRLSDFIASSDKMGVIQSTTGMSSASVENINAFPIADSTQVTMASRVRIYPIMTAELSGANFDIAPAGPQTKAIVSNMESMWSWVIASEHLGPQSLVLRVSIPIYADGLPQDVSIDVQDVGLQVNVISVPTPVVISSGLPNAIPATEIAPTPQIPIASGSESTPGADAGVPVPLLAGSLLLIIIGGFLLFGRRHRG